MPSVKVTGNTSGVAIFSKHAHKKAELVGLRVNNKASQDVLVDLLDCFTTVASKVNATGATQAAEDFETYVASGKIKLALTVPMGEAISMGPAELAEVEFVGKGYCRANLTTSDLIAVISYRLK